MVHSACKISDPFFSNEAACLKAEGRGGQSLPEASRSQPFLPVKNYRPTEKPSVQVISEKYKVLCCTRNPMLQTNKTS